MKKTLSFVAILTAALFASTPVFAHCGQCGMDAAHDHAAAAENGAKQCPPDCDKPCCAEKADKGEL